MSAELRDLLHGTTPGDLPDVDFDGLAARGVRRRHAKRIGSVAAALLLVAGGVLGWEATRPDIQVVDHREDSPLGGWRSMPASPLTPRESMVTATDGDRVLLWGGEGEGVEHEGTLYANAHVQDGAVYDVAADAWTHIPAPPLQPRAWPELALHGDQVLLLGGQLLTPAGNGAGIPVAGHELPEASDGAVFDLSAGRWTVLPPLPDGLSSPQAVALDRDEVLVFGPMDRDGQPTAIGLVWDGGDTWRRIADLPLEPRQWGALAWDEAHLVVWGGVTDPERPATERLYTDGAVYDRDEDTWEVMPAAPLAGRWIGYDRALRGEGNVPFDGRRLWIAGGAGPSSLEDPELADADCPAEPEEGTAVACHPDEELLAVSAQMLDGAVYDLETRSWTGIPQLDVPGQAYVASSSRGVHARASTEGGLDRYRVLDLEELVWRPLDLPFDGPYFHDLTGDRWLVSTDQWSVWDGGVHVGVWRGGRLLTDTAPLPAAHSAAIVATDDALIVWGGRELHFEERDGETVATNSALTDEGVVLRLP